MKKIMYVILGLYGLSVLIGVVLLVKSGPAGKKVKLPSLNISQEEGVGVVYFYGPIRVEKEESALGIFASGSDRAIARLKKMQKDSKVKAVVLRINSPGGTVASVQEIYEEVNKLKQAGKIVVASMGDVAASGGYYVACAADKIMANPGTITGSIGVIAEMANVEELFKKIGVKMEVIKSGKHKDIGNFARPMSPEERKMLQGLIDNAYHQFIRDVAGGRKMPLEKVKELADGSILTGEQAKEKGLVDELGNFEDAVKLAGQLAGLKGEPNILKEYLPWGRFWEMIESKTAVDLSRKLLEKTEMGIRLQYLMY